MKEEIIKILQNKNKALSIEELDRLLHHQNLDEYRELEDTLQEMCDDYTLYRSNKDRYMLFDRGPLKKGILRVNRKGFGFVECEDEEDVYIPVANMNGALHNDLVVAEVLGRKENNKLEGRILKVLDRKLSTVVGEFFLRKDGKGTVDLDEEKLKMSIEIDPDMIHGAVDGHKVVVKLLGLIEKNRYRGEVVKIIGHRDDPGVDILSIVYKYEIEDQFSDEVKEQLKTIPEEVSPE